MTEKKLINTDFDDSLNYNDVFIIPKYSDISSRKQVDISSKLGKHTIPVPVISANMESVTGARMAIALQNTGAVGAQHRFQSIDRAVEDFVLTKEAQTEDYPILVSVGVNRDSFDRFEKLYEAGARHFVIDIAHGHSEHMKTMIEHIKGFDSTYVMAGNVATSQAAYDLAMWGADAVKAGIGPGSVCTTKNVTGVTVPGFASVVHAVHGARRAEVKLVDKLLRSNSELRELYHQHNSISSKQGEDYVRSVTPRIAVVADGGLAEIGDICKAIGCGADFVMSGRFFAACDEAPNGTLYRGSASQDVQTQYRNDKQMPTPEGKSEILEEAGPVSGVVEDIAGGLRSAFSYVGAHNIKEYHNNCTFGVRKHPQR